jgi:DMSO reductase anchor subunit
MHPSFAVIFFTSFSGAGYGLWIWLGLMCGTGNTPARGPALFALLLGFAMVTAGLLSSTLHLGQPLRAWRAFSQWRSSWLSREGIFSLLTYLPMLCLAVCFWRGGNAPIAGALLTLLSIATVACTAMIYASLKPVPSWQHPVVLPVYLLFALFTGGLLMAAVLGLAGARVNNAAGLGAMVAAFLLWRMKRVVWRRIDSGAMPATRNSALGLPPEREVKVFERPHTEANYLLKEMGFVLARKHARKLRALAVLLFAVLPMLLALPVWLIVHINVGPWMAAAAVSAMLGVLVERWLFFAEAKHLVTLYY